MGEPHTDAVIAAITDLADEIARLCPDCAERAKSIGSLVAQLRSAPIDRETVRDALDAQTVDSELSEPRLQAAVEAVVSETKRGAAG